MTDVETDVETDETDETDVETDVETDDETDVETDDDDLRGLGALLTTRALGRVHEHHAAIDSTNERAMIWASRERAVHGALVTADSQTRGRGRLGRAWSSPPREGVYASVVVRAPAGASADSWGALGLAVAVGLREGLCDWAPTLSLKWPNDLLCDGRKLAGILCETRWQGARPQIVVGFGINIHTRAFAGALSGAATSLALEGAARGPTPGRARVLARVLARLEPALERFLGLDPLDPDPLDPEDAHGPRGFAALRGRYEPHCETLGRELRIRGGPRVRVLGLESDGTLRVQPVAGGASFCVSSASSFEREGDGRG